MRHKLSRGNMKSLLVMVLFCASTFSMSKLSKFGNGPAAGTMQTLMAAVPVGAPYQDGTGSSGQAISPGPSTQSPKRTTKKGTQTNQLAPEPGKIYTSPRSADLIQKLKDKGCVKYADVSMKYAETHNERKTVIFVTSLLQTVPCE